MPTLLKAKPSSAVNINKKYIHDDAAFFEYLDKEITQFDCLSKVIYENETMILLLIYNSELSQQVLLHPDNKLILINYGYDFLDHVVESSIDRLIIRYQEYRAEGKEFPHELGIILGYPLKDVEDFIKNNGRNYIFSGLWKVYHDVDRAERTFEIYRMVREDAMRIILSGKELSEMRTYYSDGNRLQIVN
jgi:hypothetical protein